jgi:hypothetical protein
MNVYSGFGKYEADKTALVDICLPQPVNLPGDGYKYQFFNISNVSNNALVIFLKKNNDSGATLPATSLNYEAVTLNLDTVTLFEDAGIEASLFDYSKNIYLITYHEANPAAYPALAKQLFQNLNTIVATGIITLAAPSIASGPGKSGSGGIKKM